MAITRRLRRTAMAMAIGAGMSYFLDPGQGPDRRREVAGRLRSLAESWGSAGGPASRRPGVDEGRLAAEVPDGPLFETPVGPQADPTGGAAPIQGRPTLHSSDVMG